MTANTTKPALYIFVQQGDELHRIGAAFKHRKGNGYNIVIGDLRYVAFPPKATTEKEGSA